MSESPAAGQLWDADAYARNARFVADLGAPLLEWLAPRAGERILDLGCGDGALTEKLAASGAEVVGVDASVELVTAARARGLEVRVGDGQRLDFAGEFDAVFSNAALHWMRRDADAVLAGVARALRPGGRFVAELGAAGNVGSIHQALRMLLQSSGVDPALHDPWYFPQPEDYRDRLLKAGFEIQRLETFGRPTTLPGDVTGWLETFGQSFFSALPADARADAPRRLLEILRPRLRQTDGRWVVDYVRLRFACRKP